MFGDDKLEIIRLRVPDGARTPILVMNFEKVKTFHGTQAAVVPPRDSWRMKNMVSA